MKHNITNLDKFKDIDTENIEINSMMSQLTNQIAEQQSQLIEKQLEKLIKPYVDIEKWGLELSKCILDNKNIDLKCVDDGEYTRYSVINKITKEEDFFLVQNKMDIKQEDNKYTSTNYISDIIRGIKQ